MRPPVTLLVLMLLAPLVAGCVAPHLEGASPSLETVMEDRVVPQNRPFSVEVRFENTAREPFEVATSEGCIQVEVWVRVEGGALPLDAPPQVCPGDAQTIRIEPGETREWGPYRFHPAEYRQNGEDVFVPGGTYTLVADIAGETSWPVQNESHFEVTDPVPDPFMELEPGSEAIVHGEPVAITARFHNPGDEPFTYTSRDGCNDIHVFVIDAGDDGDLRLWPDMEPYACTQALTEFEIPPGGSLETTVHWDGSADGQGGSAFVAPSGYLLVAKLDGREEHPVAHAPVRVEETEE